MRPMKAPAIADWAALYAAMHIQARPRNRHLSLTLVRSASGRVAQLGDDRASLTVESPCRSGGGAGGRWHSWFN